MKMKSLLTLLFGLYASASIAQTNIDLSDIGAQAAQDCAENQECLVQESLGAAAPGSDLGQYQSSGSGGEFALAAAGIGGLALAVDGVSNAGSENVEQINEFATQDNGGFNQNDNNAVDLRRMDDEMLLLTLNDQVVSTTQQSCEAAGVMLDDPIGNGDGDEYCDCFGTRCYECNYGEMGVDDPFGGNQGIRCTPFSYNVGSRPTRDQVEDSGTGSHF